MLLERLKLYELNNSYKCLLTRKSHTFSFRQLKIIKFRYPKLSLAFNLRNRYLLLFISEILSLSLVIS